MTITGYEIDFLPVGEESKSGDAILFRYREDEEYKVILIDGGHKESDGVKTSETILNHMREHYYPAKADSAMRIDHIICSHPDSDHVGGLQEIMEKCDVGTLWINDPIDYISKSSLAGASNNDSFSKLDAETVENLIEIATENDIEVKSPVQGESIGPLIVASPSSQFYETLVKGEIEREEKSSFKALLEKMANLVTAFWDRDNLKEYPATSVCNESSTVLFGELTNKQYRILLTADAGIEALSKAYEYLKDQYDFQSGSLEFMQIPHHGSRHNLNTKTLNNLLGEKISEGGGENRGSAIASVAKKASNYPKKAVANAFITRGYSCSSTAKSLVCHPRNMPDRDGYVSLKPIQYSRMVEAVDD